MIAIAIRISTLTTSLLRGALADAPIQLTRENGFLLMTESGNQLILE
jgi:hypothetical protein